MSKKLPEITLSDWLAAEAQLRVDKPIPPGYITISQYAEFRGISRNRASTVLMELKDNGLATKQFWNKNGKRCSIYKLGLKK